jgi:hypothetical protein
LLSTRTNISFCTSPCFQHVQIFRFVHHLAFNTYKHFVLYITLLSTRTNTSPCFQHVQIFRFVHHLAFNTYKHFHFVHHLTFNARVDTWTPGHLDTWTPGHPDTLHHKTQTQLLQRQQLTMSLPTKKRQIQSIQPDIDIESVRQHPCYLEWLSLSDGDTLKRYNFTYVKGVDKDEDRLIRRIRTHLRSREKSKIQSLTPAIVYHCTELSDDDVKTPVSPPNFFRYYDKNSCGQWIENPNKLKIFDRSQSVEARQYYRSLLHQSSNFRGYVRGALYSDIMFDVTNVYDVRKFPDSKGINFQVHSSDGCSKIETTIKVRDIRSHTDYLEHLMVTTHEINPTWGVVRDEKTSGDMGIMQCFRNKARYEYYAHMKKTQFLQSPSSDLLKKYCVDSKKLFARLLPAETQEIITSDMNQDVQTHECLGGEYGFSAFITITRDLRNSAHIDLDNSKSIITFTESKPGTARQWFFLFPNLVLQNVNKAVAIKLFHGCVISFDPRVLKHCTVLSHSGENNTTFGNLFGSKKFKFSQTYDL